MTNYPVSDYSIAIPLFIIEVLSSGKDNFDNGSIYSHKY